MSPSSDLAPNAVIHGFLVERIEEIPELRSQARIFTHAKTGARVVHLHNDDPNNLFSIAFRTPVHDSTGVPHILEHSVLCGSTKFPVKDPFQEMLKGSLQTFLNALTYPDKTVYPVSSQVEADFYNLVDVYCDAVFHPLLTKNAFYQEGWHFDIEGSDDAIDIKGIVYNEMKGVFSEFSSHVGRRAVSALFPDATYYHESGGEPKHIPTLTYGQFRDFHARYYHPSNSFIFLYGNLASEKTLQFLHEKYLGDYERIEIDSTIRPQPLWEAPRRVEIEAPAPPEYDGTATIAVSWLIGATADPVSALLGTILSRYLLGAQSSPLRRALVDSGLGEDLDDLSGFDPEFVQSMFSAGLRRAKPESAERIEEIVFATLRCQAQGEIDEQLLEGAIRQTEFRLREITGGHFPYSLMQAERCYRSWIYGGDPLAHLRFEGPLGVIKTEKKNGTAFFAGKIQDLFLSNQHRILFIVKASSRLAADMEHQTRRHVEELTRGFTPADRHRYRELTEALRTEQTKPPRPEQLATLPRLRKSDLPPRNRIVPVETKTVSGINVYTHPIFTSGIVYLDIGFDFSAIPRDKIAYLSLLTELLTRCGARGRSYQEMATRISLATGGIGNSLTVSTKAVPRGELLLLSLFHGKSLEERFPELVGILTDLFLEPDLRDAKLIKDILFEMRNDLHSSVIGGGHSFAMTHAASRLDRCGVIDEQLDGISQLRFLVHLLEKTPIEEVVETLPGIWKMLIRKDACTISMTAENPGRFVPQLEPLIAALPGARLTAEEHPTPLASAGDPYGIEISASVNFVAQAYRMGDIGPGDIGRLSLLSRNLSTGYLWDKVRVEGGAYGGMASFSAAQPVFFCASYRDPNLERTLTSFEAGLKHVAAGLPRSEVDQSIIGTIGRIDTPRSPHERGLGETIALLSGRSVEYRQSIREAVLASTPDALGETANRLLSCRERAITVLGGASALDRAQAEGMRFVREQLIPGEKNTSPDPGDGEEKGD